MARSLASVTVSEINRKPRPRSFLVVAASIAFAKSGGAILRKHADLRDVTNIGTHLRAQDQPDQRSRAALEHAERRLRIERPAAGETHNIIEEAQGPGQRPVLIVDLGIDMSAIGGGD